MRQPPASASALVGAVAGTGSLGLRPRSEWRPPPPEYHCAAPAAVAADGSGNNSRTIKCGKAPRCPLRDDGANMKKKQQRAASRSNNQQPATYQKQHNPQACARKAGRSLRQCRPPSQPRLGGSEGRNPPRERPRSHPLHHSSRNHLVRQRDDSHKDGQPAHQRKRALPIRSR